MARRLWVWAWAAFGWLAWSGCGRVAAPPVTAPVVVSDPAPTQPAPVKNEEPRPPRLTVDPERVALEAGDYGYQLLATDRENAGATIQWDVEPGGVVTVDRSGYLRAIRAGKATVRARLGDEVVSIPAIVSDPADRPWDFATDIVPVFTRAGCNTGACHGRADGQNGFHLSLFGYDPDGDFQAITRDSGGRRISPMAPEASLLLAKASGQVPHKGGQRLAPGSVLYQTGLAWLREGAPRTRGKTHGAVVDLRIDPTDTGLPGPGPRQLRVVATFADGHERDVTRLSLYRSNDDAAASVSNRGRAELLRRGEVDLVVRYQSRVVSVRLAAVVNPDMEFDFAGLKRRNVVDEQLFKRLAALRVPPSPPAPDTAFLRRVSLDLTGEQPLPEDVRAFLADKDPEKRAKLVDRLLGSREFTLFWKIKFGDLLQISQARFGNGASYYHTWLQQQLETNAPWDRSVRTLLTALGNPMIRGGGPVNYALDGPDAGASSEQTAQRFLALRLRCAQCHDHPFDVWTQDDYYGLAAFFAKVQRNGAPGMNRNEVKLNPEGKVTHLRTGKPVPPRLLDGKPPAIKDSDDPRKALADWITSPDNPYFARATANWVWSQFFGKGIADPPDDLSKANPPVHPELLDALAKHFVAHKYDLRDLIRTIATSEAYGLSSATVPGNAKDSRFFSHQIPRPLTAHQMADALAQATDVPNRFGGQAGNAIRRAIEIHEPSNASAILDTFGRCSRQVSCSAVATPPLSLRQSLLLIGGDVIESKVVSLNGYLANLLELNPEPDEVVENLYMRVLCRPPVPEELSRWSAELKQAPKFREAAEDLFWALLNSREFAFNH